jgi:hypothetical protein
VCWCEHSLTYCECDNYSLHAEHRIGCFLLVSSQFDWEHASTDAFGIKLGVGTFVMICVLQQAAAGAEFKSALGIVGNVESAVANVGRLR